MSASVLSLTKKENAHSLCALRPLSREAALTYAVNRVAHRASTFAPGEHAFTNWTSLRQSSKSITRRRLYPQLL